ncbi:hypothetical protein PY793_13600 [Acetobacter fabarum]|uniref:hypothetical protein n=1 Tax=Acetobacter fabarum TaxID=483199 RepID=UPI00312BBE0A
MNEAYANKNLKSITVILLITSFLLMIRPLCLITQHVPLEYNEGWNAYLADAAFQSEDGQHLYPDKFSTITNNYPPFSFIIVGGLGKIIGDNIIAGRFINIISIIMTSIIIFMIVFKLSNIFYCGIISSLSFLIYSETTFCSYFSVNDPQWLSNSLMLAGFLLCLYYKNKKMIIISAFLMVFSGFIKHNLLALPLSTIIYLYFIDKKSCFIFIISGLSFLSLLFGISYAEYGPDFLIDVFENKRVINWHQSITTLKKLVELSPLCAVFFIVLKNRKKYSNSFFIMSFILPFVFLSFILGVMQASAEGVNYNCFFELLIALILSLGIYVQRFCNLKNQNDIFNMIIFIILPVFIFPIPIELTRAYHALKNEKKESKFYSDLILKIEKNNGQVVCEDLSLCYWGHKNEIIDFFNTDQKIKIYKNSDFFYKIFKENDISMVEFRKKSENNFIVTYVKKLGYKELYSNDHFIILSK